MIVVTDESTILRIIMLREQTILRFLEDIQGVPKVLKSILRIQRQSAIAKSAYHKAVNRETWSVVLGRLLIVKSVNV